MKLTRDSTFDLTSLDLGSCLDLLLRRKLYPIQDNPRPPNTCSCKDEKAALEGDSISSDDAVSVSEVCKIITFDQEPPFPEILHFDN